MSHTAIVVSDASHDALLNIFAASSKPELPRAAAKNLGARQQQTCSVAIAQGKTVFEYARMCLRDKGAMT